jgi:pheophorbide a oxygenase
VQAEVDIKEVAERAGRACATVLPTRVAQGMVWVWPDSSKEGVEASRVKAPSTIAELDDPAFVKVSQPARAVWRGRAGRGA